jgi:predicted dehydrogenase/threonine dehydrogenase-like Zn-dependent dehydrogenase
MKQILQDLSKGDTYIVEAPCPAPKSGHLIINTTVNLISAGTERMLVDFGRGSYLQKARQQPEKVKMILDKARTDGVMATYEAVRSKLEQPLPLGYCNVGIVSEDGGLKAEDRGQRTEDGRQRSVGGGFRPGDRVVSNGPHAEVVRVPENLCAKIPGGVSDEEAVFTVIGAVGLQGIRLAQPTLGECFVVTGAGLIGLMTVQLLRAHGCRVLAVDFDDSKLEMARRFGAETCNPAKGEEPVDAGAAFSRGRGVDGVLICAASKSSDPVSQAAQMCRKRGRIVLVGVAGLELNRAEFYEKELTFQVSCSYGPGRYDTEYEEKGQDYPIGFVRWTEQRNFEAVLDMMADGRLDVKPLITHRFAFEDASRAYDMLAERKEAYLGIVLEYQKAEDRGRRTEDGGQKAEGGRRRTEDGGQKAEGGRRRTEDGGPRTVQLKGEDEESAAGGGEVVAGFIGAGNYASRVLIPAFKAAGVRLETIVTSGGTSGVIHGKKAGFAYASTDVDAMLGNEKINTVVIATQHNTHADFVIKALEAGKHVFVEKPLSITFEEMERIQSTFDSLDCAGRLPTSAFRPLIMVGFNRRFAPQVKMMKTLLDSVKEPKSFIMTMNAGAIPADHWTQDPAVGGGRIVGEACHYIDLMRFLAGSEIVSVQAECMGNAPGVEVTEDKASIVLKFADGSFGTIHYLANGSAAFPKERIEVFAGGRVLQLDNFRKLRGFGWRGFKRMNLWRQDKGQQACAAAFADAVRAGGKAPIAAEEIFEVSRVTLEADRLVR